jgi:hypothetical protein
MNRSKVFPLFCLFPLVAVLGASGCDGGATVSSPFSVQQTTSEQSNMLAQTAAAEPQQSVTETASQPVADPQNDQPDMFTISTEQPAVQEPDTQEADTPREQEQSTQPEPTVSNPTPADITDLVVITGQSNALGADTAFDPAQDSPDARTFAYTDNGWQVADLHQIWDQGWFPRGDPVTGPSNNLSLHFGKQVTLRDPRRVVGFVLVTAPGQPISHWQPNGEFFNIIRSKVSRAISELPSKSRVDGMLWHQGESDGEDNPAYGAALYELISAFRSESWFGYNRPFICAETATLPVNQQLNRLNTDNDPHTACVAAEGLETRGDDAHFTAAALRTIGQRYADKYVEMTR